MSADEPPASGEIAAAGGIPWRHEGGQLLLAVVHRPRYDDWSFPKGKLEPGEPPVSAAAREVGEETGLHVRIGRRLTRRAYRVGAADKVVDYWSMPTVGDGGVFVPNDEVDALAWLTPEDAVRRLSHDDDAGLVAELQSRPMCPVRLLLVRHAKAGDSETWAGPDEDRPLDADGEREAADLAVLLPLFGPDRIFVGGPLRCLQTVTPAADALALRPHDLPAVSGDGWFEDPDAAYAVVSGLLRHERPTVVVSQGGAVSGLVERLVRDGAPMTGVSPNRTEQAPPERKGSVWAVSADADGTVVAADYYPPLR